MDAAREKGLSERRACSLVGISRLTYRYRGRNKGDGPIRERMRALAHRWLRFGYRRLGVMLERENLAANHKRIYRLYTEEGLKVRRKRKKLRSQVRTAPMLVPSRVNERWSMDFMSDCLATGRRFRTLNIVDDLTRECPAIEVDTSLPGARVVRVLDRLAILRGLPDTIVIDNGSEFTGRALDAWANKHGVKLHFIDLGKPVQKGYASYCTSSVGFGGSFLSPCGYDAPHELPVVPVFDRAVLSRWFEEMLPLVVVRMGAQQTRTPPPLDAVGTDPEPPGDLPRVQHAGGTKPIVATLQIVLRADVADSPWLEGLPCA